MARYQSGRGFQSGNQPQRGEGFWVGRPEFTGAASNYDRWTIRSLVVPRGEAGVGRLGMALGQARGEWKNYKKRGGAEGVRQRMEQGGEEFARGIRPDLRNAEAPDPATRSSIFDAPAPDTGIPTAQRGTMENPHPALPASIDWDKVDQYLGTAVDIGKKVASNPTVQAGARGALTGAAKGAWAGPAGMMAGAVKGGIKGAGRASPEQSIWPIRPVTGSANVPMTGSAFPSELD